MSYPMNTSGVDLIIKQHDREWQTAAAEARLARQVTPTKPGSDLREGVRNAISSLFAIVATVGLVFAPSRLNASYADRTPGTR